MKKYIDRDKLQEYSTKLTAKYKGIFATKLEVGSPLVASSSSQMTDTNKIYVFVGFEAGYVAGNWYYYNGSAWVSGGLYNSTAFETDTTLSIEGAAADAKVAGDQIRELQSGLTSKANINGTYDEMTVGNSKQLLSTVYTADRGPYLFRTAGGSIDIGNRANDTVVGGTIVWNQLANFTQSVTKTFTESSNYFGTMGSIKRPKYIVGHKYFLGVNINRMIADNDRLTFALGHTRSGVVVEYANGEKNGWKYNVCNCTDDTSSSYYSYNNYDGKRGFSVGDSITVNGAVLVDLTQMFGPTIADYVYSLEQSNAGVGVAWFQKMFSNEYYDYNAGELMSVKTTAHKTVGFNAYDNTTGQAKLVGGHQYQITGTYTALSFETYAVTPDANGYFTVNKDGVLYVNGGNATDTCVHLVWDGERDGEYAPYEEHVYPLDADLELRGIPKLDENNNLYYDGDTYEPDGTVTRNYETRPYQSGDATGTTMITDGTTTVYKLGTPTTETAEPFAAQQTVDDFGTEEYVDNRAVPIPVGHITKYQNNLRAKLEMTPNSPDGDGDYVVRQVNGVNTYVPLEIPAELPDAPTTDGTYRLTVTITDGTPVYTWESV